MHSEIYSICSLFESGKKILLLMELRYNYDEWTTDVFTEYYGIIFFVDSEQIMTQNVKL